MYIIDFDLMTEHGKILGAQGEIAEENFQAMMFGELWKYSRRQLNNVLAVSGDEQFRSIILMLKINEMQTKSALAAIHADICQLKHQVSNGNEGCGKPAGLNGRIQSQPPTPATNFSEIASIGEGFDRLTRDLLPFQPRTDIVLVNPPESSGKSNALRSNDTAVPGPDRKQIQGNGSTLLRGPAFQAPIPSPRPRTESGKPPFLQL